jgi:Na+/H+ antiporter NhaD/arsenite permease-like protein
VKERFRRLGLPADYQAEALPGHPYRDAAIIYGCLAALVMVLGAATGRSLWKTALAAVAFFAAAMLYSWWRIRDKLRKQAEEPQ